MSAAVRVLAPVLACLALGAALGAPSRGAEEPPGGAPVHRPAAVCATCHQSSPRARRSLRDSRGRAVAPYDLWRSSMMANAAIDPLWRAVVSAEVAAMPSRAAEIEAKCLRCHAPAAPAGSGLAALAGDGEAARIAREGVTCTVCHQVLPDGFGTAKSFSGGFRLGTEALAFGPHADPFAAPMLRHSGLRPVRGEHVLDSGLCAACHTLFTEAHDRAGRPLGATLPEQTPFLEWRVSAYDDEGASCQTCHVPTDDVDGAPIRTRIARNPGGRDWPMLAPREPFGRHVFVGGNTLVPAILRDHAEELGATAPRAAFDATLERTREQLRERTARVALDAERDGERLRVVVAVESLAGHKLPSGHPSRRAWLHLVVRDARGAPVFASGAHDGDGRILGADGQPLASERAGGPNEPHRDRIERPGEVQIYEAVMADVEGRTTYRLLGGARFAKDDRVLPRGWDPAHPDARHCAPRGVAGDGDYDDGGDRVEYVVDAPAAGGPYRAAVELLYQPLGSRWAAELFCWDTPAVRAFRRMYERADRRPEVLAEARLDGVR